MRIIELIKDVASHSPQVYLPTLSTYKYVSVPSSASGKDNLTGPACVSCASLIHSGMATGAKLHCTNMTTRATPEGESWGQFSKKGAMGLADTTNRCLLQPPTILLSAHATTCVSLPWIAGGPLILIVLHKFPI